MKEFVSIHNEFNPTTKLDLVAQESKGVTTMALWDGRRSVHRGLKVQAKLDLAHSDARKPSELARTLTKSRLDLFFNEFEIPL